MCCYDVTRSGLWATAGTDRGDGLVLSGATWHIVQLLQQGGGVIPHYLHATHTLRAFTDGHQQQYSLTHKCVLKVASDHTLKVWHRGPSIRNGVLLYKQLISLVWKSAARSHSGNCWRCSPSVFPLLPVVTGQFTSIWEFLSLPNT